MPFVYYEEPVFTIPRRNYNWVSNYDFLYEKLRHLEQRVSQLENKQDTSKEDEDAVRDNSN